MTDSSSSRSTDSQGFNSNNLENTMTNSNSQVTHDLHHHGMHAQQDHDYQNSSSNHQALHKNTHQNHYGLQQVQHQNQLVQTGSATDSKEELRNQIYQNDLILLCYQNISGVRQAKLIVSDKFDLRDPDAHSKFSTYGLYLPASKDIAVQGVKFTNAPKQLKLVPDQSSMRLSPFSKNQSLVFTKLQTPAGEDFVGCPRNQLYRALKSLKDLGYELRIGIEIEFYVLEAKTLKPIEANPESSLTSLVSQMDDFETLYRTMKAHGINMEIAHTECGNGQFEIVLRYGEVMKTLDDYYVAKEIIAQHFKKKGLIVTFIPKPFEKEAGNGAHVHISIVNSEGKNIFGAVNGRFGISDVGEHFMAGIQKHFDALLHFLTPSPNSLRRLAEQCYVGAYNVWGIENKEAPLRLIYPLKSGQGSQQFEIKSFDHTANFYLALACTIAYGLHGIQHKLRLPEPFNEDAHFLTDSERKKLGITLLPKEFEQRKAIIESEQGQPLRDFFGDELIRNILLVHQQDFNHYANATIEQELKSLIERY